MRHFIPLAAFIAAGPTFGLLCLMTWSVAQRRYWRALGCFGLLLGMWGSLAMLAAWELSWVRR